jgi:7,8-dihydroneopterin aldolase/epimerase/oxygenase
LHTTILVANLELYGFHGYFDEEQRLGQKFLFDVSVVLVPTITHSADSFDSSVRYDKLIEEVALISNNFKFRTLEALGETIARRLIKSFNRIANVTVTVSKASPPISRSLDRVSVKIQLDRSETLDTAG